MALSRPFKELIESVRKMARVTRLPPFEAIQRRTWVTASTSIAELEVTSVTQNAGHKMAALTFVFSPLSNIDV